MWHNLLIVDVNVLIDHLSKTEVSDLEKVIRTVAIYALLVILLRIAGKRGLAGMTSMDLVVIFLLANVVQDAVIGEDNSLRGAAIGAVTLVFVNTVLNRLALKFQCVERLLIGRSTKLIKDGVLQESNMCWHGVSIDELRHAVRLQNGDSLRDVEDAELTPTGQFVLKLKESEQGATYGDIREVVTRIDRLQEHLDRIR